MNNSDKPSIGSSEWFVNTIQSLNLISNYLMDMNVDLKANKIHEITIDLEILSKKIKK